LSLSMMFSISTTNSFLWRPSAGSSSWTVCMPQSNLQLSASATSGLRRAALQCCTNHPNGSPWSQLCQHMLKTSLSPSYAWHCLSLETVTTITWWTVYQVLVPHVPDSNISELEQLMLPPSTTTQTLAFSWEGHCHFAFVSCGQLGTFKQRYYRPGNQLTREHLSGTFEKCNPFLNICKTSWLM
jgi:hypothetical protein